MMTRIEATLIPGGLTAVVYDHDLPVAGHLLPCWTIITGGFAALGQQEIALTVLKVREARDKVPPGVFGYLRSLFPLAEQGDFVRDGSVSSWRAPGPLNLGGFVGVAFFDPEPLPGILLPSGALAGVFLKEGEVEMALRCGVQRVLFALGRQARYFPFPHWSDPGREAVYQLGDAGRSVLYELDRVAMPGATATVSQQGNDCVLTVPADAAQLLADTLEQRGALAVQPGRDLALSAALVWNPAQAEPQASAVAGKSAAELSATFVTLFVRYDPVDRVTFLEDGYGAVLTRDTATRLIAALRSGDQSELRVAENQRALTIRIAAATIDDPARA
ncbi:MAG TPA: hypothetical protein VG937_18530 [Polyangiaceae bacterium]|nr:hypothetical protein [Polyangiaceae bacterium]